METDRNNFKRPPIGQNKYKRAKHTKSLNEKTQYKFQLESVQNSEFENVLDDEQESQQEMKSGNFRIRKKEYDVSVE